MYSYTNEIHCAFQIGSGRHEQGILTEVSFQGLHQDVDIVLRLV